MYNSHRKQIVVNYNSIYPKVSTLKRRNPKTDFSMFRGWKDKEKSTKETEKEQTVREGENQIGSQVKKLSQEVRRD